MFGTMGAVKGADSFKGITFIGTVVDNNDPDKLERVKVSIPEVFDGIPKEELPWCIPMLGRLQGNSASVAWFGVPVVGALLYIEFQNGNPHYPVYKGSPVTAATKKAVAGTNYPNRWGFVDAKGNTFYSDTSTGDVKLTHVTGTTIHIKPSGEILMDTVDKLTVHATADTSVTCDANVSVMSTGTTVVNATGAMTLESAAAITITAPSISMN